MNVQENVKKMRLHLCVNQREFASLLDISQCAISHYEIGHRKPSLKTIRKFVKLAKKHKMKVKVEDFLE
jgi:predicted transcriptional regulator